MKTFFDATSEYVEGAQQYQDVKDIDNDKTNLLFYYGIHPGYRMERPKNYKYNIYYETEEPNGFTFGQLPHERGNWNIDFWHKVINNCPYCTEWENLIYKTDKFINGPLFFNPKYLPLFKDEPKKYPVCYIGNNHGHNGYTVFQQIIESISKIPNYRFVCWGEAPHVTDVNVSYFEKLKICARCKITVSANLLHIADKVKADLQARAIMKMPKWNENEAFALIHHGLMPQIKNRILEAGFTKTLVLVLKDGWNVVEKWYTPDKHFLYFDSIDELQDKIKECLSNWDYCQKIVDNMYDHCINNYTIQAFYDNYLKKYDL